MPSAPCKIHGNIFHGTQSNTQRQTGAPKSGARPLCYIREGECAARHPAPKKNMKKLVITFICTVLAVMLCACGAAKLAPSDMKESEYNGSAVNDKVQLFIQQRTVTDETEEVSMTLENLTDTDYTYDPVQRLEIYDGSKWLVVPDKQEAVVMMIYTLPGGGTDDVTFNFSAHYDKLTEGRYRIVIPLVAADGSQTLAAAEFGIGRVNK